MCVAPECADASMKTRTESGRYMAAENMLSEHRDIKLVVGDNYDGSVDVEFQKASPATIEKDIWEHRL